MELPDYLRWIARIVLTGFGSLVFIFSLLSGAEEYGGGLKGIFYNSPNALPWLFLLIFIYIAWKNEKIGGVLISGMGLFTLFFFDALQTPFVMFTITLPLLVLGSFFIASWHLRTT